MNKSEIKILLENFKERYGNTIVIVDFGNVEKWRESLKWKIGIKQLGKLTKNFIDKKPLRRFYYGADFGPSEKSKKLTDWSRSILEKARMNNFEVINKRVKYIYDKNGENGFNKKCDLDVEMTIDLIIERDNYQTIVLFSGDGDLMRAIKYLKEEYGKSCIVFGARDHVGREVYDAKNEGVVSEILYAEDFDYRLDMNR